MLLDAGGHRLHLETFGRGAPTVVFDAGPSDGAARWGAVPALVAAFARVCVDDRAGLGRSEVGPLPRTSGRIVAELHAALARAGVAPPYVLVGHSFGGQNLRLYASRHPADVAGLVLVDASPPDLARRFAMILTPSAWARFLAGREQNHERWTAWRAMRSWRRPRPSRPCRWSCWRAASPRARKTPRPPGRSPRSRRCGRGCKGGRPTASPAACCGGPRAAGTTSGGTNRTWWSRRSGGWSTRRAPGVRNPPRPIGRRRIASGRHHARGVAGLAGVAIAEARWRRRRSRSADTAPGVRTPW